jgi:hypothetical protein
MPEREDEKQRKPKQMSAASGAEGPQEWEERRNQPWAGEDREQSAPERAEEYSGRGDWGNQAAWGKFGNRAGWRHDQDWENASGFWASPPPEGSGEPSTAAGDNAEEKDRE